LVASDFSKQLYNLRDLFHASRSDVLDASLDFCFCIMHVTGKKKSQRRVTVMVLAVITVYVICWLPYWLFQLALLSVEQPTDLFIQLFQLITFLSYANSAVNPILYAFLSNNFRKTFARAFGCTTAADVNRALLANERHSGACTQMHAKACEAVPIAQQTLTTAAAAATAATGVSCVSEPRCTALVAIDAADAEMEVLLDNSTREQTQQHEQIL
jgi:hypothetical protein